MHYVRGNFWAGETFTDPGRRPGQSQSADAVPGRRDADPRHHSGSTPTGVVNDLEVPHAIWPVPSPYDTRSPPGEQSEIEEGLANTSRWSTSCCQSGGPITQASDNIWAKQPPSTIGTDASHDRPSTNCNSPNIGS